MSLGTTLLLGFIAGVTIVLGMPLGRLRRPIPSAKVILNGVAVGILLFLVWDVFSAAWEPLDVALGAHHDGSWASWPTTATWLGCPALEASVPGRNRSPRSRAGSAWRHGRPLGGWR
jgi:hypothetical protein